MPFIVDEGGSDALLAEDGSSLLAESSTPGPGWQAARTGLPGDASAVNYPAQAGQFLITHAIAPVYAGNQIVASTGAADWSGVQWVSLGASDVDQPFTMPSGSTAVGRVTLPLSPAGNGADVTVSLCADSGGAPGSVIVSTRVPAAHLAQLAAPSGLGSGGPLATAQSNTMMFGAGTTAAWAQPAVSLNGSGNYAAPVTSGNYTILLAGFDATASAAVATVATIAYLGGGAISGPVPQPSVPQAAFQAMAAATADTVVFAGGTSGPGHYFASVWTASWDPSTGTVGAWTAQTSLPAAVVSGGMAASGSTVYVAGGNTADTAATSTAAVWQASAVNGQIQSWAAGPSLPQAVSGPYVAVVNGWLVVAGGANASGTAVTSVWCSQIQADGSLGGWQPGPSLPAPAYAYSPGWNLAVAGDAMSVVAGSTTGGATTETQTLTVTADGPAPAWQVMQVYNAGGQWQTAAYPGAAGGSWEVFNLHLATYDTVPLVPLPMISVPLPATGLTSGGTYHILCHQDAGGDLNDYTTLGLDPSALPAPAQTRPNAGGSWTGQPDGYAVIASVWDQTPGGRILHTWEDSGARITTMVYAGAGGQLLGLCEATEFEDGTMLAAVTQVTYTGSLPAGTVQLA